MAEKGAAEDAKGVNKPKQTISASAQAQPSLYITPTVSIPLKYICLGVLVIQMSVTVLTLRYSRASQKPGEPVYISATAIFLSEILKIIISAMVLLKDAQYDLALFSTRMYVETKDNWRDGIKLLIPALMYVIQNNLLFIALSNLDAATYQVTYQLKILTTALFSVCLLNRKLSGMKWFSLVVLMLGVILVQWPTDSAKTPSNESSSQLIGLFCVLAACLSSGFSGVYFEMILKGSSVSLWMRNVQLAFFSILIAGGGLLYNDFAAIQEKGFFQGYSPVVWIVIVLQGCGGLVVGAVVKYADNILKGFATSISIVVSCVMSYFLLGDFNPTLTFVIGSTGVLFSTYLYQLPSPSSGVAGPDGGNKK